jgi:exodeoxyribonuclease V alpha subunit
MKSPLKITSTHKMKTGENWEMGAATEKFLKQTHPQNSASFFRQVETLTMGGNPIPSSTCYMVWEVVKLVPNLTLDQQKSLLLTLLLSEINTLEGSTRINLSKSGPGSIGEKADIYLVTESNESSSSLIPQPKKVISTFLDLLYSGKLNALFLVTDIFPDYEPIKGELVEIKPFIVVNEWLYHQNLLFHEREFINRLKDVLQDKKTVGDPLVLDKKLFSFHLSNKKELPLDEQQIKAVTTAVNSKFSIISGGPGTGKTSIIATILKAFSSKYPQVEMFALCAPTGKAAYRMTRSIKEVILQNPHKKTQFELDLLEKTAGVTLHRLLGYSPKHGVFQHNKENPLPYRVIIVDEASMIDTILMKQLFSSLDEETHLILIGDSHQLPSIGSGAVLKELISFHQMETRKDSYGNSIKNVVTILNKNHRSNNLINRCAQIINSDRPSSESFFEIVKTLKSNGIPQKEGLFFIPQSETNEISDFLENWFETFSPFGENNCDLNLHFTNQSEKGALLESENLKSLFYRLDEKKLLCATNHFKMGTISINRWFHKKRESLSQGQTGDFLSYEPVMIIKNDYTRDLFNGDQGLIININNSQGQTETMAVFHKNEKFRSFPLNAIAKNLTLAYAISIHKSQGSEYKMVGIILPQTPIPLLTKELLYTGVTRAKETLFFVGNLDILIHGINKKTVRTTSIKELLQ